ncbi:MAG: DUF4352 domain-containing protein [Bacillota bacterium]
MTTRKIMILTAAFCGLLLTAACSNDKEQEPVTDTINTTVERDQGTEAGSEPEEKTADSEEISNETIAKAPSDQPASIGEALDYHGMIVTVHSVRESNGDDYLKPQEGNILKVLDISVENTGDEELVVSSALSFSLSDDSGEMYMPVVTSDIKQSLDGKLAPGEKLQGEIPYEVSKEVKGLKLTYMIPLKDGEAVWTIE